MKKKPPYPIKTISAFHQLLKLEKPLHPMISVIEIKPFKEIPLNMPETIVYGFYSISLKKNFKTPVKIKYGQQSYDFDEGVLSFMAPGQISSFDPEKYSSPEQSGWMLLIHPDFLWSTSLTQKIKQFDFFGYAVNEALFLSDREELILTQIVKNIEHEYNNNMDKFSHDIIITQLESLLSYSERFYQRQFMTRRVSSHQIVERVDELLTNYFNEINGSQSGLPSVSYLAENLHLSPDYLSGLLKTITGLTAQQHIHEKLIDKAKEMLSTTNLTVSEIGFKLGFEHSQSFSKIFKNKTNQSPLTFRQSFN
ncbi:helix-turn-helix domain-containing protein [Pseudomonas shirazensis]